VVRSAGVVRIDDADLIVRLLAAVVLCGVIGFERSTRDEVAGLRTHALVGLGAALFTLVSAYGFAEFATAHAQQPDPTRIAAQIVSGIGFLGAGAIIRQGVTVRGVTTASSLWIVAAIGMAAGAGFFLGAIVTTLLVLVVLVLLRRVRAVLVPSVRNDFVQADVDLVPDGHATSVLEVLSDNRVRVESMHSDLAPEGERLHLELRLPPRADFVPVVRRLSSLDDVAAVRCHGLRLTMQSSGRLVSAESAAAAVPGSPPAGRRPGSRRPSRTGVKAPRRRALPRAPHRRTRGRRSS
jgi:putative Mg2+ transporter-C (MgtC) family protein